MDAWIDFSSSSLDTPLYPFTRQLRNIDPYDKQALPRPPPRAAFAPLAPSCALASVQL